MSLPRLHRLRAASALAAFTLAPLACTLSTGGIPGGPGGGGGGGSCTPGETRACFEGPAGAVGVGICKEGVQTCSEAGAWPSDCPGQVLPLAKDDCGNALDDDCNGMVNDSCACKAGEIKSCYSGSVATRDVGVCKSGSHVCDSKGEGFGPCMGEILPQPEDCGNALDDDCDGMMEICTGGPLFLLQSGSAAPLDQEVGFAAATGPTGSFVFGGVQKGSLDFNGYDLSSGGALLAAAGADGTGLWVKSFATNAGAGNHAVVRGVALDADGDTVAVGEVAGHIDFGGGMLKTAGDSKDIFVLKLDKDGKHLWSKIFGDAQIQSALAVAVDAEKNIYLTGVASGTVNFGGGDFKGTLSDLFVVKLNTSGSHLWSKVFGDANVQTGRGIAATPDGRVAVAGDFLSTLDFGVTSLSADGGPDAFLAVLDGADGATVWAKRFGDFRDQSATGVAVDPKGNLALTGAFKGLIDFGGGALVNADVNQLTRDLFVARFDPTGVPFWAHNYGDMRDQEARGVGVDAVGNVVVTGSFQGTLAFGGTSLIDVDGTNITSDLFVAKLRSTDGSPLWAQRFGDTDDQRGWAVASTPAGSSVVVGGFKGLLVADAPAGTAVSTGNYDFFALGLGP